MASSIPALSAGILAANDTRGCPRRDRDRGGGSVRKPGPVLSGIPPPKPPRRGGVPLPFVAGIVDDEYENRRVRWLAMSEFSTRTWEALLVDSYLTCNYVSRSERFESEIKLTEDESI